MKKKRAKPNMLLQKVTAEHKPNFTTWLLLFSTLISSVKLRNKGDSSIILTAQKGKQDKAI